MKRVIIIHCWEGYPEYCWYPWVKKELEIKGFHVEVPAFPNTEKPKLNKWLPMLKKIADQPSENLYLIGHSLGCITIMRYLESLAKDQKIGGVVFVAGFTKNVGYKEIKTFFETPVNFKKIKNKVKNGFVAIHSDDDPYVNLKYADIFEKKLGAEIIIKHNAKHFSGAIEGEDLCVELSDAVQSIEKLSK